MEKSSKQENNNWLKSHLNWESVQRPLKLSSFLPNSFDNYIGIVRKVGIIEDFPFENFIQDPRTEDKITNNRILWNNFPATFQDSDEGFIEIPIKELFDKFKIPFENYKNDNLLPWNTKAIRVLESTIKETLINVLSNLPDINNLNLFWEDYYRYNLENELFVTSYIEFVEELEKARYDSTMFLYPDNKNWCLLNIEDLGFNILAFRNEIKDKMKFLQNIEHFELNIEDPIFT